ncbi:hypothetical protein [Pseudopedobacter saltans]|uniref:hypothetical protein n=1 Tax=Pseudopedobacter saltans TaxID=151895 RepID=UPI000320DE99|nr:hypothetical protein [Pseudopedobacter saltans]
MKKTFYIVAALCISVFHAFFLDAWLSKSNLETDKITVEHKMLKDSLASGKIFPVNENSHENIAKSISN